MCNPALRRYRRFILATLSTLIASGTLRAQQAPPAGPAAHTPPAATTPIASYPDSADGLEKLIKDILRATKDGDTAKSHALLSSLALPDPQSWFRRVFGDEAAPLFKGYARSQPSMESELVIFFDKQVRSGRTDVSALVYDNTCDHNPRSEIYRSLIMREMPEPLYEVHFHPGSHSDRLWAFAYVQSGFHYVGSLSVSESFFSEEIAAGTSRGRIEKPARLSAEVAGQNLLSPVRPLYPEAAKRDHLQGTVKLHALIAKDGTIQQLRVVSGPCLFVESAMAAVHRWRYRPTLLNGEPVEVETFIEVIFTLSR